MENNKHSYEVKSTQQLLLTLIERLDIYEQKFKRITLEIGILFYALFGALVMLVIKRSSPRLDATLADTWIYIANTNAFHLAFNLFVSTAVYVAILRIIYLPEFMKTWVAATQTKLARLLIGVVVLTLCIAAIYLTYEFPKL